MKPPLGLVFDTRFKLHQTAPGHPEMPARLDAIERGLRTAGLSEKCGRVEFEPLAYEKIGWVHTPEYVERLKAACAANEPFIDTPDSSICPRSEEIARLAAGAVVAASTSVARGELAGAFCAVRPPGHHAEADCSMGFCLYANIALGVEAVRRECGIERALVLDWDVHHGNGTQHHFEADPHVLFISLHGDPRTLYPGTGYASEIGIGAGRGFTLNIPMPPRAGDAAFRRAFEEKIEPKVFEFGPEMIFISCGFDAHVLDPIGNLALQDDSFVWMTQAVARWANLLARGRIVSVLEGGYNHDVLERCAALHVGALFDAQQGRSVHST